MAAQNSAHLSKEHRFLCWLATQESDMGTERVIRYSQVELAERYDSSPVTVNGWLKSLKSSHCIEPYRVRSGYVITQTGRAVIERLAEISKIIEEGDEPNSLTGDGANTAFKHADEFNYIDVFAGCGGLSLGLGESGWNGLFAVEKDPMAYATFDHNLIDENAPYRHFENWPDWLSKAPHAIEDVLEDDEVNDKIKELRGKVTLVAGGPPCQGFSVAGARNGNDPRNLLVFKQIKLIDEIRPKFAIVENVGGFEKKFVLRPSDSTTQSVAAEAMHELSELGYNVGKVVINAADYGVPQIRRRVILFAISKDYAGNLSASDLLQDTLAETAIEQRRRLGLPVTHNVTVGEAISDLAGDELIRDPEFPAFKSCDYLPAKSAYQKLMRKKVHKGDKPNCHRFNRHSAKLIALYEKAHATQPAGRLSKEFLYANGCHSNKRYVLDTTKACSTLTTAPEELIHYCHPRVVTLREMARLQSFPDAFHFYGRYTLNGPARGIDVPRNAQIGNAIPPLAGMALGTSIKKIMSMIEEDSPALSKYRQ